MWQGAFRLLWVDPNDADLFAGDLPWVPEEMENGDRDDEGVDLTVIYLVSSFGFSGVAWRMDRVGARRRRSSCEAIAPLALAAT